MMAADLDWTVQTPFEHGHGLVSDGENTYVSTENTGNVIKYDGNGNQVWSWDMGEDGNVASRMFIDGDHLYVAYTVGYMGYHTAKLTLDGDVVWNEAISVGHVSNGYATVVDGGTTGIVSTDDFHTRLWTPSTGGTMVATNDGIYIGGICDLGGFITKYDFAGHEQWTHNFMGPDVDWGNNIHVTQLVAAPNGVYFSLVADNGLTIGGDSYEGIYNMDHYAVGLLVSDDVVWYQITSNYRGELQSVGNTLFVGGNGYDQHGDFLYAVEHPGTPEIIQADAHGFTSVFYHTNLAHYTYTVANPDHLQVTTMGFVDSPVTSPVTQQPIIQSPTFQPSHQNVDPAWLVAVAQYWAEQNENPITKKRRAA